MGIGSRYFQLTKPGALSISVPRLNMEQLGIPKYFGKEIKKILKQKS